MEFVTSPTPDKTEPIRQGIQIGVDIGQRVDPTAIVVIEKQLRDYRRAPARTIEEEFNGSRGVIGGTIYHVARHIERLPLNTSYPDVANRLAEIYEKLPRQEIRRCYIDATGVGKPVVDVIEEKGIHVTPVFITAGHQATSVKGELHLAKEQMVSSLQVLLQQHRILLPDTGEARALAEELLNFEIRVTEAANLKMGVFKIGAHDDLAVALGLATWERGWGTMTIGDAPEELKAYFGGISRSRW